MNPESKTSFAEKQNIQNRPIGKARMVTCDLYDKDNALKGYAFYAVVYDIRNEEIARQELLNTTLHKNPINYSEHEEIALQLYQGWQNNFINRNNLRGNFNSR